MKSTKSTKRTSMATDPADYDVIVVGGRVAGASTAMLLARRGHRVLVVDRGIEGSDTLSTHALMKAGVIQLHRWGLLEQIEAAGTPPIRQTTIHAGADEPVVLPTKSSGGVDALYAPRRTVLDPIIVQAARAAGADVQFGVTVTRLLEEGGRVIGVETSSAAHGHQRVTAQLVIGADGVHSRVARAVGAAEYRTSTTSTAVIYSYFDDLDATGYEWFFTRGGVAGVIPTNSGTLVWVVTTPARFRSELRHDVGAGFERVLTRAAPEVAARVAATERIATWRSTPGQRGFKRQSWGLGWALVGDAAHFKDPLSAHGLTDAMRDAELLAVSADEMLRGMAPANRAMAAYQRTRDALSDDLFDASERLARLDWDPSTVNALLLEMNHAMRAEVTAVVAFDDDRTSAAVVA